MINDSAVFRFSQSFSLRELILSSFFAFIAFSLSARIASLALKSDNSLSLDSRSFSYSPFFLAFSSSSFFCFAAASASFFSYSAILSLRALLASFTSLNLSYGIFSGVFLPSSLPSQFLEVSELEVSLLSSPQVDSFQEFSSKNLLWRFNNHRGILFFCL